MTDTANHLKGLVIAEPWISLILSGDKTWEMRSKATSYRGPMAVIRKGSGLVAGIVDLVDCIPGQREAEYGASEALHCIPKAQHKDCAARWPVAWVFANARSLAVPVPYKHKNGAQSQVVLSDEVSTAVLSHDPASPHKASTAISISLIKSAPALVTLPSLGQWEIPLVTANIENRTLPVRSIIGFLPPNVIGGSNRDHAAPEMVTVIYQGRSIRSDIDGTKGILRDRSASFFTLTKAKAGDVVVIDKLADYVYAFGLKRGASA